MKENHISLIKKSTYDYNLILINDLNWTITHLGSPEGG